MCEAEFNDMSTKNYKNYNISYITNKGNTT